MKFERKLSTGNDAKRLLSHLQKEVWTESHFSLQSKSNMEIGCVCVSIPCKKVNWDFNVVEFQSHATDKTW